MPLFYEHTGEFAKIAIWKIAEEKKFFLERVSLQRDITHPHKQLQHLAGRYLLQHFYPDFPYHLIEIADTLKPFLPNEEYHFSISHCGNYAAAIVSKTKRVGIDIEMITPRVERVKHKFLSKEEMSMVNDQWTMNNEQWIMGNEQWVMNNQSINILTLLWSCKEAVYKWNGKTEVDFIRDIHLKPSSANEDKIIACDFLKDQKISLQIQYKFFDGMCLAWVES